MPGRRMIDLLLGSQFFPCLIRFCGSVLLLCSIVDRLEGVMARKLKSLVLLGFSLAFASPAQTATLTFIEPTLESGLVDVTIDIPVVGQQLGRESANIIIGNYFDTALATPYFRVFNLFEPGQPDVLSDQVQFTGSVDSRNL